MDKNRCPKCKRIIENPKARFCKYCGTSLLIDQVAKEPLPEVTAPESTEALPPSSTRPSFPFLSGWLSRRSPNHDAYGHKSDERENEGSSATQPTPNDASDGVPNKRKMTFMCVVSTCLRKYATFRGRASLREYWFFSLFICLVQVAFALAFYAMLEFNASDSVGITFLVLYIAFFLVMILPYTALTVRRLHDINLSGYFILLSLIPSVGPVVLMCMLMAKPYPGMNRYGLPVL